MPLTSPGALIRLALKAIGVGAVGQTPLAEDFNDAFDVLNGMLAQWNRNRWLILHEIDVSLIATGAQTYSIGPGGDFNTFRPDRLEKAYFRQFTGAGVVGNDGAFGTFADGFSPFGGAQTFTPGTNAVDFPLRILQSREDYSDIALKTLTTWPQVIFYDSAFPLGYIYVWPIAQAGNLYEIHLVLKDTLVQFAGATQSINLPLDYTEAIWTNLAVRLAGIFPNAPLSPIVAGLAKASISTISVANTQIPQMNLPAGFVRPPLYNIFSNTVY